MHNEDRRMTAWYHRSVLECTTRLPKPKQRPSLPHTQRMIDCGRGREAWLKHSYVWTSVANKHNQLHTHLGGPNISSLHISLILTQFRCSRESDIPPISLHSLCVEQIANQLQVRGDWWGETWVQWKGENMVSSEAERLTEVHTAHKQTTWQRPFWYHVESNRKAREQNHDTRFEGMPEKKRKCDVCEWLECFGRT